MCVCNTLQRAATHCNALQHAATHSLSFDACTRLCVCVCNTLQHTACNTLQLTPSPSSKARGCHARSCTLEPPPAPLPPSSYACRIMTSAFHERQQSRAKTQNYRWYRSHRHRARRAFPQPPHPPHARHPF